MHPTRSGAGLLALLCLSSAAGAQSRPAASPASAPVTQVHYDLTFDSAGAAQRIVRVAMTFHVGGTAPVLLSLPDWTPGAYEISNFAKWVMSFSPKSGGKALEWDKLDYDTWRVHPTGAGTVTVGFDYLADTLDNAMAWAQKDFLLVNGTNVFLYPEGADLSHYPATVSVHTQPDWLVATGMTPASGQHQYAERSYHDLVDMPFFIGKFDLDSMDVNGKLARLATYPAGMVTGAKRDSIWHDLQRIIPTEGNVIGITPWKTYNTMMIFSPTYPGGSALEHQNSHVGVYTTQLLALEPVLASITAHEMFHSWNVKRLRPADMVPYRYDRPMPTPWLWVSEGITDYYADLTLVRGGVVADSDFYNTTMGKIGNVMAVPPTALEDASLSTWIHPVDGSGYIYYPKGSLAGFLLDIMIRDASDNHHSLDQVMGQLYRTTYQKGRGFTAADWWPAVSRAAGGHSFTRFNARYIDGREPFPYDSVLPLAGTAAEDRFHPGAPRRHFGSDRQHRRERHAGESRRRRRSCGRAGGRSPAADRRHQDQRSQLGPAIPAGVRRQGRRRSSDDRAARRDDRHAHGKGAARLAGQLPPDRRSRCVGQGEEDSGGDSEGEDGLGASTVEGLGSRVQGPGSRGVTPRPVLSAAKEAQATRGPELRVSFGPLVSLGVTACRRGDECSQLVDRAPPAPARAGLRGTRLRLAAPGESPRRRGGRGGRCRRWPCSAFRRSVCG